jgi:hypothetical protein
MSTRDRFWGLICGYRYQMLVLLYFLVVMFVLTLIALWLGEPGTASYALALYNLGMILVGSALIGGVYYGCRRREG